LFPESSDRLLVEQLQGRTDKSGQFILDVGTPGDDPDLLFEQAQAAETSDTATAERLYRRLVNIDPGDPAPAFNLGNVLRADGRKTEAESAYRAAIRTDPDFAEGWYNLADVLDEQGRTDEAVACLKRAVAANPAYADAIFNLALSLQRLGHHVEAASYWRRYLRIDGTSPWAARARRALKLCEIELAASP
jgi:tetratricopeptide (TPR) repeat protein